MRPDLVPLPPPADDVPSAATSGDAPLTRRGFVRYGVAVGAGLAAGVGPGVPNEPSPAPADTGGQGSQFALDELTVADLQAAMESGRYTARQLAEMYVARIEAMDRSGPSVNSVIEVNPDALQIADAMDAERRGRGVRSPLHGIPVLIKDNIDTADRMMTSAGSLALADSPATVDAGVAKRLRDAGAVILGKANLSEWANWRSTRSSSGWSGRGGQTRNPYALDRNPCGSSSGTGAAIAANFAALGIGTETDGSIVCPASANGLVGIKPTVGLVSRSGIVPISRSQDTAGPMCRTVRDAAALLSVIAGGDARDAATRSSAGHVERDYTTFCDAAGLRGARIGVVRQLFNAGPLVDTVMTSALAALKDAGATLIDPVRVASLGKFGDAEYEVLLYESKTDIPAYLARRGDSVRHKSLADLIRFNEENKAREMPYFGQEIFLQADKKGGLTSPAYLKARAACVRLTREQGIDLVLRTHRLDALIAPTGGPAWVTDLVNGDHVMGGSSSLAAVAGYPSITVPAGEVFGLPVGLSFFGAAWSEGRLVRLGYAFEQATKARRAPAFRATAI